MPLDTRFGTVAVDAETDAVTALLDHGYLRLFTDPRPATADDPVGTATLLVEFRFPTPAFSASMGGVAPAGPINGELAQASGRVTWFRAAQSDGTPVFDGNVGTDDENMVLSGTNLQSGALVELDAFQYTSPRA